MKSENNKELLDEKNEINEEEKSAEATLEEDKAVEDAKNVKEDRVVEETPIEKASSEDNHEYKNTSYWTKEGFVEMNQSLAKESYLITIICEVFLAALAGYLFYGYFTGNSSISYLIIAIVIVVAIVGYPFLLKFIYKHEINKTFNLYNEQFNNAKYEYKINKDFILVHFMLREHNKEMTFTYQDLYRIIETNDFLFVFISNRESFTVEKKGFENPSDVDAVRKFFIDKGVKYKDFRKKVK
jgi:hypothetical protein